MYLFSIGFFYATTFVINTEGISYLFQPSVPHFFNEFYATDKVWIFLLIIPFMALMPDFLLIVLRQTFRPNPSEKFIQNKAYVNYANAGEIELENQAIDSKGFRK